MTAAGLRSALLLLLLVATSYSPPRAGGRGRLAQLQMQNNCLYGDINVWYIHIMQLLCYSNKMFVFIFLILIFRSVTNTDDDRTTRVARWAYSVLYRGRDRVDWLCERRWELGTLYFFHICFDGVCDPRQRHRVLLTCKLDNLISFIQIFKLIIVEYMSP